MTAKSTFKKQEGVALLMALFIMALIVGLSTTLFLQMNRDTSRTSLWLRSAEAEMLEQGSIAWARDQLKNNWERQVPNRPVDTVPIHSPVAHEQGFKIESVIYDLQSGFNLNELSDPTTQAVFLRLLQARFPDQQKLNLPMIVRDTAYWIDPGVMANSEGELYYQKRATSYRAAHRPFSHYSEWRLVRGVTPEMMRVLKPDLTALPPDTPINVQTATAGALMMLNANLKLEDAEKLIKIRQSNNWLKKEDLANQALLRQFPLAENKYTFVSQYFLLVTSVSIEKQIIVFYTVLQRVTSDKKAQVKVVWQSEGAW